MMMLLLLAAMVQPALTDPVPTPARWEVLAEDSTCLLKRGATELNRKPLSFHVLPGSGKVSLIFSDYDGESVPVREPVMVTLSGSGAGVAGVGRSGLIAAEGPVGFAITKLPESFVDQAARATAVKVVLRGRTAFDEPLGDIAPAVSALRTCRDDMLRRWGIDPVARAALSRNPEPVGDVETWIAAEDYPQEALRNEWTGRVLIRLNVDVAGAIAGCATLVSSGHAVLDTQTCAAMTARGRFLPARGADGRSVAASYVTVAHWTIAE